MSGGDLAWQFVCTVVVLACGAVGCLAANAYVRRRDALSLTVINRGGLIILAVGGALFIPIWTLVLLARGVL